MKRRIPRMPKFKPESLTKARCVLLAEDHVHRARRLGNGNISFGIRVALDQVSKA